MTTINNVTAKVLKNADEKVVNLVSLGIVEVIAIIVTFMIDQETNKILFYSGIGISIALYIITGTLSGLFTGASVFAKIYAKIAGILTLISGFLTFIPVVGILIAFAVKYVCLFAAMFFIAAIFVLVPAIGIPIAFVINYITSRTAM